MSLLKCLLWGSFIKKKQYSIKFNQFNSLCLGDCENHWSAAGVGKFHFLQ